MTAMGPQSDQDPGASAGAPWSPWAPRQAGDQARRPSGTMPPTSRPAPPVTSAPVARSRVERAPVADGTRPTGLDATPPHEWPRPRLPGPSAGEPGEGRRSPAFVALVAFLVGALVMGGAFASYAFGERRSRDTTSPSATGETAEIVDVRHVLDIAQPSVVTITTGSTDSIFGGAGSGVVVSADGLIVTNAHVVASSGGRISVRFHDGQTAAASLVGASTSDDIALLRADRTGLTPATLGSSADLRVGDDVVAIGNALALGDEPSVTKGIVSAKNRSIDDGEISLSHLIQTDAAINPGNSGGPLVNAAGEVVGINTAIIEGAQSVGFSIAIDEVEALLPELEAGGGDVDPDGAVLGVATVTVDADLDDALREEYGITANQGALVTAVDTDSAASDAGLLEGDVVIEADGEAIVTNQDLTDAVRRHQKGDTMTIVVERDGRRRSFTVTLGPR
ncbi:MAG: trypsin-like peptidase domain-containing protein [Actinobacteria bacterium]|nr:trypsin-like peptidase domain-containing protein [Actinomycetota bacterium]